MSIIEFVISIVIIMVISYDCYFWFIKRNHDARREGGIIIDIQNRFGCSRDEAMKRAVDKRREEVRSWR